MTHGRRPRLLDLFCGAGGAAAGYAAAGFDVIGVDVVPQPRYPYEFRRGSAFDVRDFAEFDAVHASPVCKVHTSLKWFSGPEHTNQIPAVRRLLRRSGLPYVIENVVGAPLHDPALLCGSMFGLAVRRHRLFELGGWTVAAPACDHATQDAVKPYAVLRYHSGRPVVVPSSVVGVYGGGQGLGPGEVALWRQVMEIDWMTRRELAQAIPPAYTRWLGRRLRNHVRGMEAVS